MARPLRPNIAGAVYHVMSRGNERMSIYRDDEDRARFLRTVGSVARRYGWECLAFCLMDNHYHLILRTPRANLSRGMCVVNSGYASSFNERHKRDGHLFQGRFRSVLTRSSAHLRIVLRYVLRNPVAAELCAQPHEWRWSSYRWTVAGKQDSLVAASATLGWFGEGDAGRERFVRFIGRDDTESLEEAFIDEIALPSEPGPPSPRPPLEQLLVTPPRGAAIALAHAYHGYSLTQIAKVLGQSPSSIGRALVAFEAERMFAASTWPPVA